MDNSYFCRQLIMGIAALLILGLNSCQRANYSFQSAPGATHSQSEAVASPDIRIAKAVAPVTSALARTAPWTVKLKNRLNAVRKYTVSVASKAIIGRPARTLAPAVRNTLATHYSAAPRATIPPPVPVRQRSKGIALILSLLTGLYGGHRFYLGYRGRGFTSIGLALLVPYLFLIGGIAGNSLAGILLLAGLGIWLLVDIIRISMSTLKPKNGGYYPRLFQVAPKSDAPFTK